MSDERDATAPKAEEKCPCEDGACDKIDARITFALALEGVCMKHGAELHGVIRALVQKFAQAHGLPMRLTGANVIEGAPAGQVMDQLHEIAKADVPPPASPGKVTVH